MTQRHTLATRLPFAQAAKKEKVQRDKMEGPQTQVAIDGGDRWIGVRSSNDEIDLLCDGEY